MLKFPCFIPKLFLKINGIKSGRKLKMIGWPFIFRFPGAQISIGDNCTLNSSFFSNLLGLYQRTIVVARRNAIVILGNNVGISGSTIYARERIEIGDDTMVGANVKIIDNDFHPIDSDARLNDDLSKLKIKPVKIGKNVFIGCNSIILKGTTLGDNCVVGAGSVVCGSFEAGTVIAGNPASVIRKQ